MNAPCHVETPLPTTFWPPVAEIENFTVSPPGAFNVTGWGRDHYFGATFSNSFASRMALLHAPAAAAGVASGRLAVPSAGTWYVCVRYEAPYHFEAEFTVTVKQGAATRLSSPTRRLVMSLPLWQTRAKTSKDIARHWSTRGLMGKRWPTWTPKSWKRP